MNGKRNRSNELLDRAVAAARRDEPETNAIRAAADRVLDRIRSESGAAAEAEPAPGPIETCDGFRALLPAHRTGRLEPASALLLEDHLRECVPCRRAWRDAAREPAASVAAGAAGARRPARLAVAAALVLAAIVGGGLVARNLLYPVVDGTMRVVSLRGDLLDVGGDGVAVLQSGDVIGEGREVRSAKGSSAVLELADGSRIEMRERSELSVDPRRDGRTVRLGQGSIIVRASPQGSGHLDVATDDCLASVKGTIFSVNRGTKGSRVSVIEGEVVVDQGRRTDVLLAGDQISTHRSLGRVPVVEEIAWSRDFDDYVALLREMKALQRELDENVSLPGRRYDSRLLREVPASTAVYAAIPNVGEALADANEVIRRRVASSEVLSRWFDRGEGRAALDELEPVLEKVREFAAVLGEEIVVAVSWDEDRGAQAPVVLSTLRDAASFRALFEREVEALSERDDRVRSALVLVEGSEAVPRSVSDTIVFRVNGDLLRVQPTMGQGPSAPRTFGGFEATPFGRKIASVYDEGASWLFAADLARILEGAAREADANGTRDGSEASEALERSGMADLEHLIVEVGEGDGKTHHAATVTFRQERRGVVSWLADPAPMGALAFVTPDASLALAAVTRDPAQMLRDLRGMLDSDEAEAPELELLAAIASPIGGELVVALDGPALPTPSWKVVLEVYDPVGFRNALQLLVDRWNETRVEEGLAPVVLEATAFGSRNEWTLRVPELPTEIRFAFADGYLVAAPRSSLIDRALEARRMGVDLPHSKAFGELLPRNGQPNFSAILYQNAGEMAGPLARLLAGVVGEELTPQQRDELAETVGDAPPSLGWIYAEPDRIVLAATTEGGIVAELSSLMGMGTGVATLPRILAGAVAGDEDAP